MDIAVKERFLHLWTTYFGDAALPIAYYYTNEEGQGNTVKAPQTSGHNQVCFLGQLQRAFKGEELVFTKDSFGCPGGLSYSGFQKIQMPNFEYFLSCGIEGKMEGERYKRTPELARNYIHNMPWVEAPARHLVFKRWDRLAADDVPEVVIFFSPPDVVSGLFTLDNFEEPEVSSVITPFTSGCGSILMYPNVEKAKASPKSVLGMFDVSARPSVPHAILSLAIPFVKFERIIASFEESFVITESWKKVQRRMVSSE